jgi:hypothetical protein
MAGQTKPAHVNKELADPPGGPVKMRGEPMPNAGSEPS